MQNTPLLSLPTQNIHLIKVSIILLKLKFFFQKNTFPENFFITLPVAISTSLLLLVVNLYWNVKLILVHSVCKRSGCFHSRLDMVCFTSESKTKSDTLISFWQRSSQIDRREREGGFIHKPHINHVNQWHDMIAWWLTVWYMKRH